MKFTHLLPVFQVAALGIAPAATFDFGNGSNSANNSQGGGLGNVTASQGAAPGQSATIDGIALTITAVNTDTGATGTTVTLGSNSQGWGVLSSGETGSGADARRIGGSIPLEGFEFSFDVDVKLDSFRFGAFTNGEVIRLEFVSGTNPFTPGTSLTLTGTGAQGPAYDILLASDPIVTDGIGTISANTVLRLVTPTPTAGGVLFNELTVSDPSAPPGDLVTSIIDFPTAPFPSPTLAENQNPGSNLGATAVQLGNAKGQSFSLSAPASLTGFAVEIASVTATGDFSLQIFRAMDGLPWLLDPIYSDAGALPAGLAAGNLLKIDFPAPVEVARGSYLVALAGLDATDFGLTISNDPLFAAGAAARNNSADGWRALTNADADLVFAVLGTQDAPPPAGTGPNLIFVLADDLGWTDIKTGGNGPNVLGGMDHGSGFYQTPNLARLAAEGLSFTNCHVHPNCAPTRAALLSGQYAPRSGNGVYHVSGLNRGQGTPVLQGPSQNEDVPASHVTVAEALQSAGYVTAHFGKYHVGNHEGGTATMPENQGFDFNFGGKQNGSPGNYSASGGIFHSSVGPGLDAWAGNYTQAYVDDILEGPVANPLNNRAANYPVLFPNAASNDPQTKVGDNKHVTDGMGDAAVAFMNDHRQGTLANRPFYMQFHFYAVHTPIQPRSDLATKYGSVPDGPTHANDNYAALVEGMDQTLGRILDYLDDPNRDGNTADSIASNTVIMFCSDNGGHIGPTDNDPLRHRKGSFWEGGLRVPLIVRQPGSIPAGIQTDTLVHAVDFYPTLVQFAGGTMPGGITFDGTAFTAHSLDPVTTPRDREPIFYHFPGYLDQRARPCDVVIKRVNGTDYKLIYNYDLNYTGNPSSGEDTSEGLDVLTDPWELYDLTNDLSETTDLLDDTYWNWIIYGPIADQMAAESLAWLTQPGADWNAKQLTVRATGATVPHHPGDIPDVTVDVTQSFRILAVATNPVIDEATIEFSSAIGFLYDIEATSDPSDPDSWATLANDLPGEAGSTTRDVNDPGISSNTRRFYRAVVRRP